MVFSWGPVWWSRWVDQLEPFRSVFLLGFTAYRSLGRHEGWGNWGSGSLGVRVEWWHEVSQNWDRFCWLLRPVSCGCPWKKLYLWWHSSRGALNHVGCSLTEFPKPRMKYVFLRTNVCDLSSIVGISFLLLIKEEWSIINTQWWTICLYF